MNIKHHTHLQENIDLWEPEGFEVVRTIDTHEDTLERIGKHDGLYYLYRYFMVTMAGLTTVACSVDLNGVDADRVIQHLGEQL
jgi:hypothetical protein